MANPSKRRLTPHRPNCCASANMNDRFAILSLTVFGWAIGFAQLPDNLVVEGVPPAPPELKNNVGRYLEFRAAGFNDWHPTRREMIITTRFADATQLHW